jgi:hypothetical protein
MDVCGADGSGRTPRNLPDVRVGQVWLDNDKRTHRRSLRVVEVPSLDVPNPGHVKVTVQDAIGRKYRIRLDRFRPTSTGYRLEQDVHTQSGPAAL